MSRVFRFKLYSIPLRISPLSALLLSSKPKVARSQLTFPYPSNRTFDEFAKRPSCASKRSLFYPVSGPQLSRTHWSVARVPFSVIRSQAHSGHDRPHVVIPCMTRRKACINRRPWTDCIPYLNAQIRRSQIEGRPSPNCEVEIKPLDTVGAI